MLALRRALVSIRILTTATVTCDEWHKQVRPVVRVPTMPCYSAPIGDAFRRRDGAAKHDALVHSLADEYSTPRPLGGVVPRPFQVESYIRCLAGDSIIMMPTGTGKTLVAAMVLQKRAELQVQGATLAASAAGVRAAAEPARPYRNIGLFIVEKQVLAEAQRKALEDFTGIRTVLMHSDDNACGRELLEAQRARSSSVILVATSESFRSRIDSGELSWSMVHTLVIDEVHHWGRGEHAFTRLMREFYAMAEVYPAAERPRFMGLSASQAHRCLMAFLCSYLVFTSPPALCCKEPRLRFAGTAALNTRFTSS